MSAYRNLASQISGAVARHQANSAALGAAECPAERTRYGAEVRPMLERMEVMSIDMDAHLREMGCPGSAEMQATCQAMLGELDDHLAVACSANDVAAEATRHQVAMDSMLDHEMAMLGGMQGGSMMGSGGGCH
ncbi:MAG TPA: hypothetical protein VFR85_00765 [Anaeromyxobacteraceae bacterium]|nr:hypothetical protein [Anaeromyxobacteraceae bacterium]